MSNGAVSLPVIIWMLIVIAFLARFWTSYVYPVSLLINNNQAEHETAGKVTEAVQMATLPVYLNGETGWLYTIDGKQYYIPESDIPIGSWIKIRWVTNERVVLEFQRISQQEAQQFLENQHFLEEQPPVIDDDNSIAGTVLMQIGFFGIILGCLCIHLGGSKLAAWLCKKDSAHRGSIIPSRVGLAYGVVIITLPTIFTLGAVINGYVPVVLIWGCTITAFSVILWKKRHMSLIIKNKQVIYIKTGTKIVFTATDIKSVAWQNSVFPHNRSLVVVLTNGMRLSFDQIEFWGLSDAYHVLQKTCKRQKTDDFLES